MVLSDPKRLKRLKYLFKRAEINNGLNILQGILDAIYRRDDYC